MMKTIPMLQLIELNKAKGLHFFDLEAMRFFDSRLVAGAFLNDAGREAFFVTSEQFHPSRGEPFARRWTVRAEDMTTGRIREIGKFQQYEHAAPAIAEAKRLAEGQS